jgi:hypothetical protein
MQSGPSPSSGCAAGDALEKVGTGPRLQTTAIPVTSGFPDRASPYQTTRSWRLTCYPFALGEDSGFRSIDRTADRAKALCTMCSEGVMAAMAE